MIDGDPEKAQWLTWRFVGNAEKGVGYEWFPCLAALYIKNENKSEVFSKLKFV